MKNINNIVLSDLYLTIVTSRQPVVCAVTSLGYDHMRVLGSTLSEIAWQKSGIFKVNYNNTAVYVH